MKAYTLPKRISAGSLLSSEDGFLGLSNEKKGPASYTNINFSYSSSLNGDLAFYPGGSLNRYELLYPLKPKNPV